MMRGALYAQIIDRHKIVYTEFERRMNWRTRVKAETYPLLSKGGVVRSAGVVLVKRILMEIDQHHPVCADFGGFAISFRSRIHPLLC
jgi:hypothetical protein